MCCVGRNKGDRQLPAEVEHERAALFLIPRFQILLDLRRSPSSNSRTNLFQLGVRFKSILPQLLAQFHTLCAYRATSSLTNLDLMDGKWTDPEQVKTSIEHCWD